METIEKMEIKQIILSAVTKRLFIIVLVMNSYNLYAQSPMILGRKYEVKANFIVKDSVLVISYKNMLPFSQLIWASDFCIAAIFSQRDVSGSYLASPITQEIYLVNKTLKPHKTSNSFFLRNDSSELNLYNYKILDPGDKIEVSIKINNDSLYKQIIRKKIALKGAFSFIDFANLELWASKNKEKGKKWASMLEDYTQIPNTSRALNDIRLKDIVWQFNRKADVMNINGLQGPSVQEGKLSAGKLIYPLEKHNKKLILFSYEELYWFANRQIFEIEVSMR